MEKNKFVGFLWTLLWSAVATALFAVAVCCYIYADLGSDSVSVFQQGLSTTFRCSLGTASYIYSISVLLLDLLISRKNIGWASIINALLLGSFIDLMEWALHPLLTASSNIFFRCGLLAAGILLVSLSCVILIRTNKGKNVLDAVAWGLSEKLRWPYRIARICVDAAFMLAGWLMGGVVFYGSIAAVFLTGPVIQFFNKIAGKFLDKKKDA